MIILRFPAIRKQLGGRGRSPHFFTALAAGVADGEWIVKAYYAASALLAADLLMTVKAATRKVGEWDFLWPLAWLQGAADVDRALQLLTIGCFISSLAAVQFHRHFWARAAFSILFLMVATVPNSQGGINHPYHAWIWVAFVLLALPNGDPSHFTRAARLSYLTVIRAAQALFLLFYTMSGLWKVAYGLLALAAGQPGNFSPDALGLTLANRVLETGTDPLLADFVINNVWLAWPMFFAVMYIQAVSVVIAFRPSLHQIWGYLLIGFHLGTWVLMEIMFKEHVLLLILLLVYSPQRKAFKSLPEAVADLPLLGWLPRLIFPRPRRAARPSLAPAE